MSSSVPRPPAVWDTFLGGGWAPECTGEDPVLGEPRISMGDAASNVVVTIHHSGVSSATSPRCRASAGSMRGAKQPCSDQAFKQHQGPKLPKLHVPMDGSMLCPMGMAKALLEFSSSSPKHHDSRPRTPNSGSHSSPHKLQGARTTGAPQPCRPGNGADTPPGGAFAFTSCFAATAAASVLDADLLDTGMVDALEQDGSACMLLDGDMCGDTGAVRRPPCDLLGEDQRASGPGSVSATGARHLMPADALDSITMEQFNPVQAERAMIRLESLKPHTPVDMMLIPTPATSYASPQCSLTGSAGCTPSTHAIGCIASAPPAVRPYGAARVLDLSPGVGSAGNLTSGSSLAPAHEPGHALTSTYQGLPYAPAEHARYHQHALELGVPMGMLGTPSEEHVPELTQPSDSAVEKLAAGVLAHYNGDWAAASDTLLRMTAHALHDSHPVGNTDAYDASMVRALQQVAARVSHIKHATGASMRGGALAAAVQPCFSDPGPRLGRSGSSNSVGSMATSQQRLRVRVRMPRAKGDGGTRRFSRMGPRGGARAASGHSSPEAPTPDGGSASAMAPAAKPQAPHLRPAAAGGGCAGASEPFSLPSHLIAPLSAQAFSPVGSAVDVRAMRSPSEPPDRSGRASSHALASDQRHCSDTAPLCQALLGARPGACIASGGMCETPASVVAPPCGWDAPVITIQEAAAERGLTATPDSLAGCCGGNASDDEDPISLQLGVLSQPCSPQQGAAITGGARGVYAAAPRRLAPMGLQAGQGLHLASSQDSCAGPSWAGAHGSCAGGHMGSSPHRRAAGMGGMVGGCHISSAAAHTDAMYMDACRAEPAQADRQRSADPFECALGGHHAASAAHTGLCCGSRSPVRAPDREPHAMGAWAMHGDGEATPPAAPPVRRHGSAQPRLVQQVMQRQWMRAMSGGTWPATGSAPSGGPGYADAFASMGQQQHEWAEHAEL